MYLRYDIQHVKRWYIFVHLLGCISMWRTCGSKDLMLRAALCVSCSKSHIKCIRNLKSK